MHWTSRQIDQEPFVAVLDLFEYWANTTPPLCAVVASAVGWKKQKQMPEQFQGKDWGKDFFGPAKPGKRAKSFMKDNPERQKRFEKLEEMKANGRIQ